MPAEPIHAVPNPALPSPAMPRLPRQATPRLAGPRLAMPAMPCLAPPGPAAPCQAASRLARSLQKTSATPTTPRREGRARKDTLCRGGRSRFPVFQTGSPLPCQEHYTFFLRLSSLCCKSFAAHKAQIPWVTPIWSGRVSPRYFLHQAQILVNPSSPKIGSLSHQTRPPATRRGGRHTCTSTVGGCTGAARTSPRP